jgi:hypothetical protein
MAKVYTELIPVEKATQRIYSVENFNNENLDKCMCSICLNVLFVPTTVIKCGHTFCNLCISNWYKTSSTCPLCKCDSKYEINKWIETNVISCLEYKCLNDGCNFTSIVGNEYRHIVKHHSECNYRILQCACGIAILKKDLIPHLISVCPDYFVKCKLCSQHMVRKDVTNVANFYETNKLVSEYEYLKKEYDIIKEKYSLVLAENEKLKSKSE